MSSSPTGYLQIVLGPEKPWGHFYHTYPARPFPDLPDNAKICVHCRRTKYKNGDVDSQTSRNLSDISQNDVDMDQNESFNSDSSPPSKVNNTTIVRSQGEIELEDILSGLKEKFCTLQINDSQKLNILTIAPEAWRVNKIEK